MRRLVMLVLATACGDPGGLAPVHSSDDDGGEICAHAPSSADASRSSCIALTNDRLVDVMFVIDDGPNALAVQARLADAIDELLAGLDALEPAIDLHVAIIAAHDGNPGCPDTLDSAGTLELTSCREHPERFVDADGVDRFEELCGSRCELPSLATVPTPTSLDATPAARPWLERSGSQSNLGGGATLAEAVRCGVLLGNHGCPYDAPIGALEAALDRSTDPLDPAHGFFRDDGIAAVIVLGTGSECTLGFLGGAAFDPEGTRALWTDPLDDTPNASLCWDAGMRCEPPIDDTRACVPADLDAAGEPTDGSTLLIPVERALDFLVERVEQQGLIAPDRRLSVLALAGVVETAAPGSYPASDDAVAPACTIDGEAITPAARLEAIAGVDWPGLDVELHSACVDDYADALAVVLAAIDEQVNSPCFPACAADVDDELEGLQVECRITAEIPGPPAVDEEILPRCIDGAVPDGQIGCWTPLVGEQMTAQCRDLGWNLEMQVRWAGPQPAHVSLAPSCKISPDKRADCPGLP